MVYTSWRLNVTEEQVKVPAYRQVEAYIRERIESGEWLPGTAIPSERELERSLGFNRITVRRGILTLAQEGLLQRRHGAGNFVAKRATSQLLVRFSGFREAMLEAGEDVRTELLDYRRVPADATMLEALQLEQGAELVKITRVRSIDEGPVLYGISYIPWSVCPLIREDCEGPSLYAALARRAGIVPVRAVHILAAVRADNIQAQHLGVPTGAALQFLGGTAYTAEGTPVEFFQNYFHGERIRLVVHTES